MPRAGRFFLFGLFLCLTSAVSAQPLLSIDGFQLVERVKLGRGRCQYSFLAEVSNRGTRSVGNLSATLVATPSSLTVIQGDLYFGEVPAGTTATSQDSFILQKVRQGCQPWYRPDPAALEWWFQGTETATIPAGTQQRATWKVPARGRPVTLLSLDTSEEECSQVVSDAGPDQTV